ncbi:MAG: transposase [Eubacterium sp.]|jgi:putative transposase|nr:transposase [Eubacterium sp.]
MTQLNEKEMELAMLLSEECGTPAELTAKLKNLFAGALEKMLEAELEEHLGYEKNSIVGNNTVNSRNGYGKKTVKSEWGESEIAIPRDRNGTFEPQIIEKRQTRTDDIETRILAMYAKGMSTRDIEDHLRDIYGMEASASLISRITDKILPAVSEWQSRPLDRANAAAFDPRWIIGFNDLLQIFGGAVFLTIS